MHSHILVWSGPLFSLSLLKIYLLDTSYRLVRLSILLSILRIVSPLQNLSRAILFIGGLFVLMWFSLMMTFVGRRVSGYDWYTTSSQRDREWTQSVAIFELISTSFSVLVCCILTCGTADILSDCTLISLAIYSLRSVKLPHSQRRLIIAAFSSNIFVTIVSSCRAVCQVLNISTLVGVVIEIEVYDPFVPNPKLSHSIWQVACSLFVCNSLFVTTLVYRILRHSKTAIDANPNLASVSSTPLQFTTVDLDALDAFGSTISSSTSAAGPATTCPGGGTEKYEDIIPRQVAVWRSLNDVNLLLSITRPGSHHGSTPCAASMLPCILDSQASNNQA